MILEKIYSQPAGLFQEVTFKKGINFIFGKKDTRDTKKSLNGIGKSLLLDILNYCLCSNLSERLKKAKAKESINLQKYSVVLEFKFGEKSYKIKRSFDKSSEVVISYDDEDHKYKLSEAKEFLCELFFYNPNYTGKYFNNWLRQLIPFFLKIQPPKKDNFSDPVRYIQESKVMELIPYHLFFMGIDNTLSYRNFDLKTTLKAKSKAISEVKNFIEETYGLNSISEASNELDKIGRDTKSLEEKIKDFKLAGQYKDSESSSNELTEKIKKLFYENYSDNAKIKSYLESSQINIDFNANQISKVYSELNQSLGIQIKKTLDQAISFKKDLAKSRQEFLKSEIEELEKIIETRNEEIKKLEEERAKIFKFLEAKEAIKDLSEAFLQLSKKQEKISELSGKIGLHTALVKEQADLKAEDAKLYAEIVNFVDSIRKSESEIRAIFSEIYNSIYVEFKDKSNFSITTNDKTDRKIDINVSFPADLSKGKNQGRTLVYDLTILIHALKNNLNMPHFLVHDGIFDGMDKAHFVHLYKFIQEIIKAYDFQYIVTLNEEGVLSDDDFGEGAENLTKNGIEKEAVLVLTPEKKLFGEDF